MRSLIFQTVIIALSISSVGWFFTEKQGYVKNSKGRKNWGHGKAGIYQQRKIGSRKNTFSKI